MTPYASKRDCRECEPDEGHRLLGRNPARVSPHPRPPRPALHRTGDLAGWQAAEHPVHSARRDGDDGRGLSLAQESARALSGRHDALSMLHADSAERGDPRHHPIREHHHHRRAFRPGIRARHAAVSVACPPSRHRHRDQHGSVRQVQQHAELRVRRLPTRWVPPVQSGRAVRWRPADTQGALQRAHPCRAHVPRSGDTLSTRRRARCRA